MRRQLLTGLRMTLVMTIMAGILYPALIAGIATIFFPREAAGSLVEIDGRTVGSILLGQQFTADDYFHPRPSAIDYNGRSSGGSNLGPTNPELLERVERAAEAYRTVNGIDDGAAVPVDATTTSASGLDPSISVANARLQAARVADARGMNLDDLHRLIERHTQPALFGFLSQRSVNVLELNLALDGIDLDAAMSTR